MISAERHYVKFGLWHRSSVCLSVCLSPTSSDWITPVEGETQETQGIAKTAIWTYRKPETVLFKATVPVNHYYETVCGENSMRRKPHFNDFDLSLTKISRSPDASVVNISEIMLGKPHKLYIF